MYNQDNFYQKMDSLQLPVSSRALTSNAYTFVEMIRRQIRESRAQEASQEFISVKRTKSIKIVKNI